VSVIIDCNKKIILKVKNSTFRMLYYNIVNDIEKNHIALPSEIKDLIDKLFLACSGIGTDLAKF
jgi:hypothetical protein